MMDGITILAIHEITRVTLGFSIAGLTFVLCGLGFLIYLFYDAFKSQEPAEIFVALMICALCAIGAYAIFSISGPEVFDHYEYDVLIEDQVSLTDFNERYEILKQNGLIYTIKER